MQFVPAIMKASWLLAVVAACTTESHEAPRPAATVQAPDVTSTPASRPIIAQLTSAPEVPQRAWRQHPAHVVVELTVKEVVKPIAPGVTYTFWTYGGDVPGKFIRVRQGDEVEVHLKNDPSSKLPHNVDFHAVAGPGGGAVSTFTAPGHESRFTFRATRPGLYVYHCATAPVPMHVANGMYGLILVDPPEGYGRADHEYYVMQGELYTAGKYHAPGLQTFDMDKGIDERPTYVVFNGAEGSLVGDKAIHAKTGDRVRLYVGNGGPNLVSSFHVIGGIFDKVYPEAGLHPQEDVQTTLIPSGGAAIVEMTFDVPGTYSIVDHSLFRAFNQGAVAQIVVDGPSRNDLMTEKITDLRYDGNEPAEAAPAAQVADDDIGKATFGRICAACHQPQGQGIPGTFPPLAKSDYLATTAKATLIGHVLHGLQGPVAVNGTTYTGQMPPMAFLSDDEIAGALTFARASWGNQLDKVSPQEVAGVRGQTASKP